MKKNNTKANVFAFIALTSGGIWLGAYVARLLTTYQLFEAEDLTLKEYITQNNITAIFHSTYPIVNLTIFTYLVMLISFTIYLVFSELKLKENGWLFITALIIYLTLPFEFILMLIDYNLFVLFMKEEFTSELILPLIVNRITKLGSFPIILLLSYISIPYFIIFKPFTKKPKHEN
jgi:hypothetical protein